MYTLTTLQEQRQTELKGATIPHQMDKMTRRQVLKLAAIATGIGASC